MLINIEFIGDEPLENIITSLNYRMDKTIYFGRVDMIAKYKAHTEKFLGKYCGVKEVLFYAIEHRDILDIVNEMRAYIIANKQAEDKLFFDITGGESEILVAFGMLAKEFMAPIHMYDIAKNELIVHKINTNESIEAYCKPRDIKMNLDMFIELHGAKINESMKKDIKDDCDEKYLEIVEKVWKIARGHITKWNSFASFLKSQFDTESESELSVRRKVKSVEVKLVEHNSSITDIRIFNKILKEISDAGLIKDYRIQDGRYFFTYESLEVKNILMDGGTAYELHVFNYEKKHADDCRIGVHIDWDGIFDPEGRDVLNEIDVLKLNGNIPTFISCKTGSMESSKALMALYELETVATRFGGKYAKKILATAQPLGDIYLKRAKEMGIEVR